MAPPFPLKEPHGREFKGGDLLAQSLKHLGVEVAFGLHGGHLDAFLMGAHEAGIRLVDTRHETAAVQAAEGYSKTKPLRDWRQVGQPVGVCFVTANSGFCNGIPGLATAFADRSAILCITSSAPMRDAETNVLQGFHDQVVLSKPMTKFAHRVTHAEEIPRLVAHAYRTASSSTPGPVLLDFPIEVLFSPVQQSRISWGSLGSPQPFPAGPHPSAIAEAIVKLRNSQRPVIVTGTGARLLRGNPVFESFLEQTHIPVFHSNKYSSPLPYDHPLRGGMAELLTSIPHLGKEPPDLVILLACRTGMFLGSRSNPCIPSPDVAQYIQIDVDGSEIGRSQEIHLGIVSDVRPAIESLAEAVQRSVYACRAPPEWVRFACSLKAMRDPMEKEIEVAVDGKPHPFHALKLVFMALEPGNILCVDGGECGSWTLQLQEWARAHAVVFTGGYLGLLGNGWGYCLGAAIAEPSRQIVNIQGDGSAGFHLAELDTYARFKCNILTVVVNNHMWGMSHNGQELMFGSNNKARPISKLSHHMSYAYAALSMANKAARVDYIDKISTAVTSLSQTAPAVLELVVSNKPIHPGTFSMVGMTDDKDKIVIPYYDNIPRPQFRDSH